MCTPTVSANRQSSIFKRAELLDQLGERVAVDVLHGEPAGVALLAGAVEGDQVGVLEVDGGRHGADEALDVLVVVGEVGVQDLDGDVLAVAGVAALVDRAGASLGQHRPQLVVRDGLAGQDAFVGFELARRLLGGHQGVGVGDAGRVQLEPGAADLELLVVLERVFLDLLAVDERAADAVEVDQRELAPLPFQLAVQPRDAHVGELGVRLFAAADRQREALGQVEDSARVGAGGHSQIGLHRGCSLPPSV